MIDTSGARIVTSVFGKTMRPLATPARPGSIDEDVYITVTDQLERGCTLPTGSDDGGAPEQP